MPSGATLPGELFDHGSLKGSEGSKLAKHTYHSKADRYPRDPRNDFFNIYGRPFWIFWFDKIWPMGSRTCPRSDLVGDAETAFTSPEPRNGAEIVALRGQAMSWYLLK